MKKKIALIDAIVKMGHHSVLEHINITFGLEGMSRACSHQLVRHRIASYCLSGDTTVVSDMSNRSVKKRTLKDLFETPKQYLDMMVIRCVDEDTGKIVNGKIKSVISSGNKEVFEVTTEKGYTIKSTNKHRFFTDYGWKRLEELSSEDEVYVNGVFSPPNKGKTKYNYAPLAIVSQKMKGNTNCPCWTGKNNPNWKGDSVGTSGAYIRSSKIPKTGQCEWCGDKSKETHHRDKDPRNNSEQNRLELCVKCHKLIHKGYVVKHIIKDKIKSIKNIGTQDTYDIEMFGPHHNFIANGFVVHNSQQSQRYVKFDKIDYVIPPSIANNNEICAGFEQYMDHVSLAYGELLELGVNPEDARFILPNACCTNITMTVNSRELMEMCKLRLCATAQWEIREMFGAMKQLIKANRHISFLYPYLNPKCDWIEFCPEGDRCCGRHKTKDNKDERCTS